VISFCDLSSDSTFFCAEMTVLWLRRPKKSLISLRAERVYLRASHMASIRGCVALRVLRFDLRLAGSTQKTSETAR